ncbi:MAG: D-alanine--poly(phosphoribitol) ligase subunit DltA [Clostridiales bacterium]|nr:D-alanine--poly(phosphoribitol) ligase subunit DltA [Clostridiales bacterium]
MEILEKISRRVVDFGSNIAFHSSEEEMTYEDLWEKSDRLAWQLDMELGLSKKAIVVYGHKNPWMVVCFFACVKSGRAYCPVDTSMPEERIEAIVKAVDNVLVLATDEQDIQRLPDKVRVMSLEEIKEAADSCLRIGTKGWVKPEDVFYIIFTSGSTGEPKGVQITSENLSRYTQWSVTLGDSPKDKEGSIFLNQAPFSFDLSVMDTYTALVSGGTVWCLDKEMQKETRRLLDYIAEGTINYWVSTPSFADVCLSDKGFDNSLLPELRVFLFCGEKLRRETAKRLRLRFPKSIIVNTYGPTESTVAVSQAIINDEMIKADRPLPIGQPKPGTILRIIKDDGSIASDGEKGEIEIIGDTVSPGYFNNPEKTEQVFSMVNINGKSMRAYRTGDEGFIENEVVHHCGRIDLQVKVHGYRIEMGDIEANLMSIGGIESAAVVPKTEENRIRYLAAFLVSPGAVGDHQDRRMVRIKLKEKLPEYMIPKKIVFIDKLPMTENGKTDRKKLEEYL